MVHFIDFPGGTLVAPDYGAADNLAVFVQHNKAVHLSRKTDTDDVGVLNAAFFDDSFNCGNSRIVPVSRILLRIAVLGLIHGVFNRRRSDDLSRLVEKHGFRAACADVDSDYITHKNFSFVFY